jgi:NAD(P)-dependent dehydrogenase (short-subunit alcohol dehydrogenase family)
MVTESLPDVRGEQKGYAAKMSNPYSLEGKLILVTGAGTGIGQGIALEAARQGADVVLSYASSATGAQEAVEEIKGMGRRATAIRADLGVVADCIRLVDEAATFLERVMHF